MRVSTSWTQQQSVNAMLRQQGSVAQTQIQLSTGLKNLTPSDDPIAAKQILDIQESIDRTTQYQENADVAKGRNSLESSTLMNIRENLLTVRESALQAMNEGTLTAKDKLAINEQVKQVKESLLGLVNTQDSNGEYIFSGALSKTPTFARDPIVYQGGNIQRELQIGVDRKIADGDIGLNIFEDIPSASAAATRNIFDTLDAFSDALTGAVTPYFDTIGQALTDIDSTMEKVGVAEAKAGARLNALESQENENESYLLAMKTTLSDTKDLDYAEAISRFQLESSVLQAAQQSFSKVQGLSLFNYL